MNERGSEALAAPLEAILGMREDHRCEMNCRISRDSWHARAFTTFRLLRKNGAVA